MRAPSPECQICKFWDTKRREGYMAPCTLHYVPLSETMDEDGRAVEQTGYVWMPDLGRCGGFIARKRMPQALRIRPVRRLNLQSIQAIKITRDMAGISITEAKRLIEGAMAAGRKEYRIQLMFKDFEGYRRRMAECGFTVEPIPLVK